MPPEIAVQHDLVAVREGGTAVNAGTAVDPDGVELELTASIGSIVSNGDGSWSWQFAAPDGPDDSQTVTVVAADSNGASAQAQFSVEVANAEPVILDIAGPDGPVAVGDRVALTVDFADCGANDTHSCRADWGDATASEGVVEEGPGTGRCTVEHRYSGAGVYLVSVGVTDDDGAMATASSSVLVGGSAGGSVTGGGWLDSPAGAMPDHPLLVGKATFGFAAKNHKAREAPSGNTEFQFNTGDLNFKSTTLEWLLVADGVARFKGTGTVNGTGEYQFVVTAKDGDELGGSATDGLRIWISGVDGVVYDNAIGSADPNATTEIGGGSIVVHLR